MASAKNPRKVVDEDTSTGEMDRWYDEMNVEARALGYESASDMGFRMSLSPDLKRARVESRKAAGYAHLMEDDDEGDEEGFFDDDDDTAGSP